MEEGLDDLEDAAPSSQMSEAPLSQVLGLARSRRGSGVWAAGGEAAAEEGGAPPPPLAPLHAMTKSLSSLFTPFFHNSGNGHGGTDGPSQADAPALVNGGGHANGRANGAAVGVMPTPSAASSASASSPRREPALASTKPAGRKRPPRRTIA